MSQPTLEADVREALRIIIDPELGINIVDLGLIYDIAVDQHGDARITMTTTTRGCPAASFLKDAAKICAEGVTGIGRVEVALVYEPAWSANRIRGQGKG
jgi:metal-sulfur cluster biosynthetic enzyme